MNNIRSALSLVDFSRHNKKNNALMSVKRYMISILKSWKGDTLTRINKGFRWRFKVFLLSGLEPGLIDKAGSMT